MNYSLTSAKLIIPGETRDAFNDLIQRELAAHSPEQAVKALYSKEANQLQVHLKIPKK